MASLSTSTHLISHSKKTQNTIPTDQPGPFARNTSSTFHHHSNRRHQACMPIALSSHGLYSNVPFPKAIPTSAKLKLFNLPCPCDQHALLEHFGSCGVDVESLEIRNHPNAGTASAYVTLTSLDQAYAAMAQLNGARFQERCVRVDLVRVGQRGHSPNVVIGRNKMPVTLELRNSSMLSNRLYIGNLPWRVNDASLQQLLSAHGTVHRAEVVRDRINGRSCGFGFVVMSTPAEVQRAISVLNGCEIEGRRLKLGVASPSSRRTSGR